MSDYFFIECFRCDVTLAVPTNMEEWPSEETVYCLKCAMEIGSGE